MLVLSAGPLSSETCSLEILHILLYSFLMHKLKTRFLYWWCFGLTQYTELEVEKLITCSCVDLIWNLILEHIWLSDTILPEEVMYTTDDVSLSLFEDNVVKGLDEVFVALEGSKHICSLVSWTIRLKCKRLQCKLYYSWIWCLQNHVWGMHCFCFCFFPQSSSSFVDWQGRKEHNWVLHFAHSLHAYCCSLVTQGHLFLRGSLEKPVS